MHTLGGKVFRCPLKYPHLGICRTQRRWRRMEVGGGRPREGGSLTPDPRLGARTTAPESAKAQARGQPRATVNSSGLEFSQTSPDRTPKGLCGADSAGTEASCWPDWEEPERTAMATPPTMVLLLLLALLLPTQTCTQPTNSAHLDPDPDPGGQHLGEPGLARHRAQSPRPEPRAWPTCPAGPTFPVAGPRVGTLRPGLPSVDTVHQHLASLHVSTSRTETGPESRTPTPPVCGQ